MIKMRGDKSYEQFFKKAYGNCGFDRPFTDRIDFSGNGGY